MGIAEDRISDLPDPILVHILSFLPTKLAFSTSILSKRWRYLYTSIPILDFHGWQPSFIATKSKKERIKITKEFIDSVEKLLFLPSPDEHGNDNDNDNGNGNGNVLMLPINIQKFCLSVNDHIDSYRVFDWISTLVLKRRIEHISLSIDPIRGKSFGFPPCFFTCETLNILELERYSIHYLPESISFPSLKIVRFKYIKFEKESLIDQFVSNCPVLEELIMEDCSWDGKESVICISAAKLKCLNVIGSSYFRNKYNRVIKIQAPNLESLTYIDAIFKDYVLFDGFPLLADANIDFTAPPQSDYEIRFSASKLLAGLSSVKLLKLSNETLKVLCLADSPLPELPTFFNLINLEVTTVFNCARPLLDFLWITPNLESIVFAKGFCRFLSNKSLFQPYSVAECLLLRLKVVEIREFDGRPEELQIIEFFFQTAKVLRRMTIVCSSTLPTCKKYNAMKELVKFSKGLPTCVVNLL